MKVTDLMWIHTDSKTKKEEKRKGYYMDGYLAEVLSGIPGHLKKDWDVIGIVSGRNLVRLGKSTMAFSCAYFVAWLLAGGEMCLDREDSNYGNVLKSPTKPVKFDLSHVVFDIDSLMKIAHESPMNSVFVLDEGKRGLDAKSTMTQLNKKMEDFVQACGVYNHVIFIVLPDFFSLNKDFATARTKFLIDVYKGKNHQRGFFRFFAELRKEQLYEFGRKLLGTTARYLKTGENFRGRFTKWMPFDREEYDILKKKALNKVRLGKRDINFARQRDIMIYLYKNLKNKSSKELETEISEEFGVRISVDVIKKAISHSLMLKEKKLLIDEQKEEEKDF